MRGMKKISVAAAHFITPKLFIIKIDSKQK